MKKRISLLLLLAKIIAATCVAGPVLPVLPSLQWLDRDTESPPGIGQIHRPDGSLLATVSGGWTKDRLSIHVLVNDPDHVAPPNAGSLWAADSIEIGIDAAGDANGSLSDASDGPIGADDFKLIFGLLESGAAVNSLAAQSAPDFGEILANTQIDRTADGQTLYQISLPWTSLNVVGGARPALGLDVKVNDLGSANGQKSSYYWGEALRNGFYTSKLHTFQLGTPSSPFLAVDWDNTFSWESQTPASLRVGIRSDQPLPVALHLGEETTEVKVPGGPGFQFKEIAFTAQPHGATLSADAHGTAPAVASQTVASTLYETLQDRIAALLQRPDQHPLFIHHLHSLSALLATDWGRVQLLKTTNPRRARASVRYYQDLLTGLDADTGDWTAYLDGRRSLVMAYVSPHDQTTQYYLFCLPRDWDEFRSYPLFFELHGAGNDHPLAGFSNRLAAKAKRQDGFGYESPKVYAEIERSGYWVEPFGRGNLGYEGIARIDILEAYDHVHNLVSIDPDRRYLYGFSMGGQGAFTLGARTPDRWAAAGSIAAASRSSTPQNPIIANWSLLPYKIMCGEEDRFITDYHGILSALALYDIHPEARSIPNVGHNYKGELQKELSDWLKSHVRQRPDNFTFVTDDNLTNTCWGLTLVVPQGANGVARATYRREGQTLYITSEGTERLDLDPSEPDGLGVAGEITVVWNGKEAYRGPAKQITLGR